MRLICPECNALYDIADAMIPPEGREVECSACGHVWLQMPATAASARPAKPAPAPAAPQPSVAAAPLRGLSGDLRAAARAAAGSTPDLGEAPVLQRPLPDDVLSILREETARELGARRATRETPPEPSVPTAPEIGQVAGPKGTPSIPAARAGTEATDMPAPEPAIEPIIVPAPDVAPPTAPVVEDVSRDWPATTVTRPLLDSAPESPALPATESSHSDVPVEAPPVTTPAQPAAAPMPAAVPGGSGDRPPVPRRRMPRGLPDVEQLAATIHTAQQPPMADVPAAAPETRPPVKPPANGYRTGLLRALSVAAALLVAYVAGVAWVRSGQAPATVVSLVAGVDGLRAGLQDVVAAIIGREVR